MEELKEEAKLAAAVQEKAAAVGQVIGDRIGGRGVATTSVSQSQSQSHSLATWWSRESSVRLTSYEGFFLPVNRNKEVGLPQKNHSKAVLSTHHGEYFLIVTVVGGRIGG